MNKETLIKFLSSPGLCSIIEVKECQKYFEDIVIKTYDTLLESFGYIPHKNEILSQIRKSEWYLNYFQEKWYLNYFSRK